MITRVIGRATETYWRVEPHTHIVGADNDATRYVFDAKPEIIKDVVELDPVEICQYDRNPMNSRTYNGTWTIRIPYRPKINVGDEEFDVIKETFYADLGEWRQVVDKVVENFDHDKETAEAQYAELLREYNEQMINEDEKLKAYCKLHHLDPARTDVDELKKIVYGNYITLTGNETMTATSETVIVGSPSVSCVVSNNTLGWI